MSKGTLTDNAVLIVGLTPQFLEKSVVWFEKNTKDILRARLTTAHWRNKTVVVEPHTERNLSALARELHDIGYATVQTLEHPGELTRQGGVITVFPINMRRPIRIDFSGNLIESVELLPQDTRSHHERLEEASRIVKESKLEWLRNGDYVVHLDHGIGIYRGTIEKHGAQYLALEYARPKGKHAEPDMLYVPESLAHKVSAYIGFRTPNVHRLGTLTWEHTKKRAKEDVAALARDLLALYAKRSLLERPPYTPHTELEDELAASFIHEETKDQTQAVHDVFQDMERMRPMDRLILADVGFGKTEVAIRAAFRAALNGRQVVVVCPTTILCEQHMETFTNRLSSFPITVARLSRLDSKEEERRAIKGLADGTVDILIATHRTFSKDITFRNLGLLILDEEQRFGVKQKEHIKKAWPQVDVLSLSATPIPRTLHISMARIREMSVIATPPPNRIAPKTFVLPYSKVTIREALAQEYDRAGQSYFLCNHIRRIPHAIEELRTLVPHARIEAIHGRMHERDIARIMHGFRAHEIDILVSTTIIENGLDISNANTIVVQDATRIGLAQAHQLRGRIGRGSVPSYAYFLYPAHRLPEKAGKRLDALFRTQYLGAGQDIAMRDMDIRGAGNILGRDQSGRINHIGFNLYCQMLAEAVEALERTSAS